jgi:hypothetical protein
MWELIENRVYNKPNGCSATGALAPGPDQQQQQEQFLARLTLKITALRPFLPPDITPILNLHIPEVFFRCFIFRRYSIDEYSGGS